MSQINVAVIRGGPSSEHEVSLSSGEAVLKNLPPEKYFPHDIVISRTGKWLIDGEPQSPASVINRMDVIFNALHGEYGEDGRVQQLLENFQIPYTGSGIAASSFGMQKPVAKKLFASAGLKVPRGKVISDNDPADEALNNATELVEEWGLPLIVKPASCGSSVGVSFVREISGLKNAMSKAFSSSPKILIEKHVGGREASCGVIDNFRGQKTYALPPIEIIPPPDRDLFDYEAKYSGASQEICPGRFSTETKRKIEEIAKKAHLAIGARHYSRSDMIVATDGEIYLLEINTLPGITEQSLVPKALNAVGSNLSEFIDHVIQLALKR